MAPPKTMINLLDYTLPELTDWMQNELGEPKFRAVQVWQWIWQKMARDFDAMTNVSKACRERLAQCAEIRWPEIVTVEQSSDDTTKFLLRLQDGAEVETVLIPSDSREGVRRWTQCLSSQVGCAMACTFCSTGTMGFERNMTMGEILGQILVAREHLGDTRPDWPVLRNLVFMGMGEPLLNLKNVMRALESLNNDKGLNFSPRRITVSTCGIEKGLRELGESGLAYLAVSLHAPTQELRARIMPKAARWPLEDLLQALKSYPLKTRERITFEYLLLGGVNDGLEQARQLARAERQTETPLPPKEVALAYFTAMSDAVYPAFAEVLGGQKPTIKVRSMVSRWGVCAMAKRQITFALQLYNMPPAAQIYVVVHEYCHFLQPNHSPAFWAEVAKLMPDWKARRDLLKR